MNSTTPKWHAETLQNWNIPFQLKKRNTYRNGIDNLDFLVPEDLGDGDGCDIYDRGLLVFLVEVAEMVVVV